MSNIVNIATSASIVYQFLVFLTKKEEGLLIENRSRCWKPTTEQLVRQALKTWAGLLEAGLTRFCKINMAKKADDNDDGMKIK